MTEQDITRALARMARAGTGTAEAGTVTPARALRLSLARAAEGAAGIKLSVGSVTEIAGVLDELCAAVEETDLVLGLHGPAGLEGLAALDSELRSAFVEAQTMGRLSADPAPDRPISVADAALAAPVIDAFLVELQLAAEPTALAGWSTGVRVGGRIDGPRGVGLTLAETRYRMVRLVVDLGVAGREGALVVALPPDRAPAPEHEEAGGTDWSAALEEAVMSAPADLTAVLHRLRLPLSRAEGLSVGDLLPLDGVTVSSVALEGAGGVRVARGRLGQMSGVKAVRIEPPPPPELSEGVPTRRPPSLPVGEVAAPGQAEDAAMAWAHDADQAHEAGAAMPGAEEAGAWPETGEQEVWPEAEPGAAWPDPAADPAEPGAPHPPAGQEWDAPDQWAEGADPGLPEPGGDMQKPHGTPQADWGDGTDGAQGMAGEEWPAMAPTDLPELPDLPADQAGESDSS